MVDRISMDFADDENRFSGRQNYDNGANGSVQEIDSDKSGQKF